MKLQKVFFLGLLVVLVSCDGYQQQVRIPTDYVKQPLLHHRKPGAAVGLENAQVNPEISGVQYAIDPGLISCYDGADLELSVKASEGLYIVGGDTNPTMTLSKGKLSCPFTVVAAETGRYYLYLNAKVNNGGTLATRALTFIVQVGEEETVKDTTVIAQKSSATGEILVSLPAQEEIIQH